MVRKASTLLLSASLLLSACVSWQAEPLPAGPSQADPSAAPSTSSTTTTIAGPVTALVVVDAEAAPIAGVSVGDFGHTDAGGRLVFRTPIGGVTLDADGYVSRFVSDWQEGEVQVTLEPVIVRGMVRTSAGDGLEGVPVALGGLEVLTDGSGWFEFIAPTGSAIRVDAPGWAPAEVEWLGSDGWVPIELEPIIVRGLHISGWAVGNADHWQRILALAAATEINALVVDLKDESGLVFYPTTVPLAGEVGAINPEFELDGVVAAAARRGLYLIGRIVTFQDPIAARALPEIAVWDSSTGGPFRKNGQYFLDPTDPEARRYALELAAEACAAGFDEIQFDYVRYPDGFGTSALFDAGSGPEVRPSIIRDFLAEASAVLRPAGCAVAADIFGFITSTSGDGGIGQQLEDLGPVVDVLSPMLYPSHYSEGWFGFDVPNDHPGEVVGRALDDGLERLDSTAIFRPWIQDFYYNAAQVRAEIDAAEERGLGWMLWNARSRFTDGALLPAD